MTATTLVVFLLVHLHAGVQGLQVLLDGFQRVGDALGAAFFDHPLHPFEDDGVGVAGRQGERPAVPFQIPGHVLLGLVCPLHDGFFVVAGSGQDADPREHEDGRQPEQGKVDAETAGPLQDGGDAEQQRGQPQHCDGQRHPAVAGLAALVRPLAPGRLAQLLGQLRLLVQVGGRVLQRADGALRLVGQLGLFAGGLLPLPLGQALFRRWR